MLMFTLAISCLTASNLPWFIGTFQVPMEYCSLQHLASITSHIHSWVLFLLWLHPFILSGVISPLISSSILGTYRPGKFIFQCPIFLPFHTVHGVLKARILKWFAIPCSSGPQSDLSTMTCLSWWLHTEWLSFTELDMAVAHVIRLASCLWYSFSPSALWCPLLVPTLSLGFLLPWTWGISSRLLQESTSAAPYLGCGVAPLSHSCAITAAAPEHSPHLKVW